MGTLYIVATPIGNLKDVTLRALEILKQADVIFAEDTRVANKLLSHYGIEKSLERYDEHSHARSAEKAKKYLAEGKNIALVTDAGTPGISDPGSRLVDFIKKEIPDAKIIPIPGPSAITAALSASGLNADQFTFLGYPPHKKGRKTFFENLKKIEIRPVVFYESPHRIEKTLEAIAEALGSENEIIVARELTKVHEEIWRGSAKGAQSHFQGERRKGEFVLIIP